MNSKKVFILALNCRSGFSSDGTCSMFKCFKLVFRVYYNNIAENRYCVTIQMNEVAIVMTFEYRNLYIYYLQIMYNHFYFKTLQHVHVRHIKQT